MRTILPVKHSDSAVANDDVTARDRACTMCKIVLSPTMSIEDRVGCVVTQNLTARERSFERRGRQREKF
jgi:hypothetical protein